VNTGHGSISFVAGCCWVNSVIKPPPLRTETHEQQHQPRFGDEPRTGRLQSS
jgi:hypothetical protein